MGYKVNSNGLVYYPPDTGWTIFPESPPANDTKVVEESRFGRSPVVTLAIGLGTI